MAMARWRAVGLWLCALGAAAMIVAGLVVAFQRHERDPGLLVAAWTLDGAGIPARPVVLPAHLDAALASRPASYRLRADVTLPPSMRGPGLSLVVPYLPAGSIALRVNGRDAELVSAPWRHGYRSEGTFAWDLPAESTGAGSLRLELEVAHTWTQSGWIDAVPRLVRSGEGDLHLSLVRTVNGVAAACGCAALVQVGITYLAIYLVDRRRKAFFWFAVQGLTAAFYPLWATGFTVRLLGRHDVAALGILNTVACVGSLYFTHATFGIAAPPRAWWLLVVMEVALAVVHRDAFDSTRDMGSVTVAVLFVTIVYQLGICIHARLRPDPPRSAGLIFACWSMLALTGWNDGAYWLSIGAPLQGAHISGFGLGLFSVLQSILLSGEHATTLRQSDDLNAELVARVRMLESRDRDNLHLNEELRRQIADRSRQLFASLALGDREAPPPVLGEGTVIDERYRVVRPIGSGGMGTVYEVIRVSDGRRLALKVATGMDGISLARLAREAQIAAQVSHPNVVGIVDVGVATSGFLYLVLELVDGPALQDQRERFGDVPWALAIVEQLAAGLGALHASGVVHRDLKPANVLVTGSACAVEVKITDFGISRRIVDARLGAPPPAPRGIAPASSDHADADTTILAAESVPRAPIAHAPEGEPVLTQVGLLTGTPLYMAPELAVPGASVTASADMFSFGVLAFELLTGRLPFDEPPIRRRMRGEGTLPPPSLARSVPGADASAMEVLDRCLSDEPSARPTAHAVEEALRRARTAARDARTAGRKST
jgi:serine/threonine protein kinase